MNKKSHPPYYVLMKMIDNNEVTYQFIAKKCNMPFKNLIDKIIGNDDFTIEEGIKIAEILNLPINEFFLSCAVST